tara:strand:- start:1393 stop:1695 length:303 start_codon:yes stop_codon:yes gene_type:complete
MSGTKMICECNQIDWSGKGGKYIHIDSGEIYDTQKHGALDCQAKVREGIINYGQYFQQCKYIPGAQKSYFPNAHLKIKKKKVNTEQVQEGIPPIPEKLFK